MSNVRILCTNKKVLLRERKRHTARRVVSTPSVVLPGYPPGGGTWPGYPPRGVPDLGTPPGVWVPPQGGVPDLGTPPGGYLTWVPPRGGTWLGYPPRGGTWPGYPPGESGYPPGGYLTWVPPRGGNWLGYPPRGIPALGTPPGGTWIGYPPGVQVPPRGGTWLGYPPGGGTWPGYPPRGVWVPPAASWHSGKCLQSIMGYGYPPLWTDRLMDGQTRVKTLPSLVLRTRAVTTSTYLTLLLIQRTFKTYSMEPSSSQNQCRNSYFIFKGPFTRYDSDCDVQYSETSVQLILR